MLAEHAEEHAHEHAPEEHGHTRWHPPSSFRDAPLTLVNLPRLSVLALIWLYQMTLSRLLPPDTCRFYPTCSRYGFTAIARYGLFKGGWMAAWRVLRCNPFNAGGYDPVP